MCNNDSFVFLVLFLLLILMVVDWPGYELKWLLFIIMVLVRLLAFVISTSGWFSHCLLVVFIEEITFEHCLGCWVLQMDFIFLYCFCVFPLLIINVIFIKIIIILRRFKLSYKPALLQSCPIEIFEPWMSFDFCVSIEAQSTWCFSLKALYKII